MESFKTYRTKPESKKRKKLFHSVQVDGWVGRAHQTWKTTCYEATEDVSDLTEIAATDLAKIYRLKVVSQLADYVLVRQILQYKPY